MSAPDLTPQDTDKLVKLALHLPYFSANVLKVKTKTGAIVPFKFNRAQEHLHDRLERMRREKGYVRAIIVKGRQLGASTYVQARFYHQLWRTRKSLKAFVLTNRAEATENLFGIARRYYDHHDDILAKPHLSTDNSTELVFADKDCGYKVATAGAKATGRGSTFQLFHGSEVAYWENSESHSTGAMQTVGDAAEGTEIILESTADGVGNYFHRVAMAAIRGASEFEAIFLPWFWGDDYARECPASWEPSEEWLEYATTNGLTWEQLYWAFMKNREMCIAVSEPDTKPCWKFKQEYPATFDEAFQSSGRSFIPAMSVLRARRPEEPIIGRGPVILGVDPARSGDKIGIIDRCGRRMGERICMRMDPPGSITLVAAAVAQIINRINPDQVNIDVGGNGAGVYDILADLGYDMVNPVNFGSNPMGQGPTGEDVYFNRRAEMWDLLRDWFEGDSPVQVPDDDGLQADLCAAQWGPGATRHNTNNELIIEEKDKIKARLGSSPDLGDAAALTFAMPHMLGAKAKYQPRTAPKGRKRTGY